MILIAHRGLFNGFNEPLENRPEQIKEALAEGFDAEIDVRYLSGEWWLGHDGPSYKVDQDFLEQPGLWLHCKNFEALISMQKLKTLDAPFEQIPNYFWHQKDDYTLTSHNYVWTFPNLELNPTRSILNQPEWRKGWLPDFDPTVAVGVCSKFVATIREKFG